ncbi:MAG TPA: YggS family pyridoxal phosphate-dependent enzyme [Jatrophihabitans sp.]|nr:YggS family pyridoxal phosphate-dependent enzyme [Jatrophihabitans sp.]
MTDPDSRRSEIVANLGQVRERIARACLAAGRSPAEVTLIAVTKFFPVADAVHLAEAGVPDLGESRDQEAAAKAAEFAGLTRAPARWHFIGRLQTNKARSVARYADLVHSVDRPELAEALAAGAERAGRVLPVLVQLSLDEPATGAGRGGSARTDLLRLAERVAALPALSLAGVMAIAPLDGDPERAFAELAEGAAAVRAAHPAATIVSAGMSGDLEAAVRHGSTHVRVGTALLGRRATHFG